MAAISAGVSCSRNWRSRINLRTTFALVTEVSRFNLGLDPVVLLVRYGNAFLDYRHGVSSPSSLTYLPTIV